MKRRLLGRSLANGDRQAVYLGDQALEIDAGEIYEVERTRVFFADVRLMTLYYRSALITVFVLGAIILVGLVATAILWDMPFEADVGKALCVLIWITLVPFVLVLLVQLRPVAIIRVIGHRNRALMSWRWQHAEARAVFAELSAAITAFQDEKRRRLQHAQEQMPAAFAPPPGALADGANATAQIPFPVPDQVPGASAEAQATESVSGPEAEPRPPA